MLANFKRAPHLLSAGGPGRQGDAVNLGPQDGCGLGVCGVRGVRRIKVDRAGESLGRAPEQGPCGCDCILGEGVHQLRDAVMKLALRRTNKQLLRSKSLIAGNRLKGNPACTGLGLRHGGYSRLV